MATITLGGEEQIYRDMAFKALVEVFGEEEAKKLIDADEDISDIVSEEELEAE